MVSRKLFEGFILRRRIDITRNVVTSRVKVTVTLDDETRQRIENNILKPRHHPGIVSSPTVHLPGNIKSAIKSVIGDTPMKQLKDESGQLSRCLFARMAPVERDKISMLTKNIYKKLEEEVKCEQKSALTDEDTMRQEQSLQDKARHILKQRVYNWRPLDSTNRHVALVYLIARCAPQYAVMTRVFSELVARDPEFTPKTLFDFGSGVGTVSWSASEAWGGSLGEYFCVDSSAEMNNVARSIAEQTDFKTFKKTFYRQFLPSSSERKYDIVVSSYSLLELPSAEARAQAILNLWNKTNKYLVLVEYGTLAGFKIINEARDLLLMRPSSKRPCELTQERARILAPCPHRLECPRAASHEDRTPCNFQVAYFTYPQKEIIRNELFSYLILQKDEDTQMDDTCRDKFLPSGGKDWPRVVRPVLNRSRHTICRLCTGAGKLQEIIFSPAKHGKITYRCAKSAKWGDTIPVTLEEQSPGIRDIPDALEGTTPDAGTIPTVL